MSDRPPKRSASRQVRRASMLIGAVMVCVLAAFPAYTNAAEQADVTTSGHSVDVATKSPDVVVPLADRQLFFDKRRVYCDVNADNVHRSGYDVSMRARAACYRNSGNGGAYYVQRIRIRTALSVARVWDGPYRQIGTPKQQARMRVYSFSMPTHRDCQGPGWYKGNSTVTITVKRETKAAKVLDWRQLKTCPPPPA